MQKIVAMVGVISWVLGGCSSVPKSGDGDAREARSRIRTGLADYLRDSFAETRSLDVFFATNRERLAGVAPCADEGFGVQPGRELRFGKCRINIPRIRSVGGIEATNKPRADTNRYLRVLAGEELGSDAGWIEALKKSGSRGVLVFVHGFNVKFEEAVLRASQIAYDLKFQGAVVLLSWPAGPAGGFLESTRLNRTYQVNRENAAAAVEGFSHVLRLLTDLDLPLFLTVHSMGHQVALPALARMERERPVLEELFLNAPDFPVEEFRRLLPQLRKISKRITVYCSYQDNAIAASELVNQNRRLGACERFEGVDVVNVSDVDTPALGIGGLGHGYYAGRAVLNDLFQAILGIEAERRLFIRHSEPNSPENFFLRP